MLNVLTLPSHSLIQCQARGQLLLQISASKVSRVRMVITHSPLLTVRRNVTAPDLLSAIRVLQHLQPSSCCIVFITCARLVICNQSITASALLNRQQVGRQFLLQIGVREVPQASVVIKHFLGKVNSTWEAAVRYAVVIFLLHRLSATKVSSRAHVYVCAYPFPILACCMDCPPLQQT